MSRGSHGAGQNHRGGIAAALCAACAAGTAQAWDLDLGNGLTGTLHMQASIGAGVRTQAQLTEMIGKLNIQGQQQFCEDKVVPGLPISAGAPGENCTNIQGNADFLALPGYASVNTDNGDLNYNRGQLYSAAARLAPRLQLTWGDFGLDFSGVYFYDAVNSHFEEYHPNNLEDNNGFQPRNTLRPQAAEKQVGAGFKTQDLYISGSLPLPGERTLGFKIGEQVLSLGTSTQLIFNSLNAVNPPDANLRFLPGSDLRDIFIREPLAVFNTNFTDAFGTQLFYQFGWRPVELPPIGSYYSTNDVIGAGSPYVGLLFGKYREDPDNLVGTEERTQGNAFLLSSAGRTVRPGPEQDARKQGQYGITLNYLATWLNNSSFSLSFLHLHSRFPFVNFISAIKGCASDATNQAEALASCRGFNGPTHLGVEPIPVDTVKFFISYPEDINALGGSFSTNLGAVAWTGEIVFRPNQPLQVDPTDLGFAALQPVFPGPNINFGVVTLPSRRTATPDYVETIYRHETVGPQQVIRGYERMHTLSYNTSFLLLNGASENPFGSDQVTSLLELGAFQVMGMPGLDQLQFAAPGTQFHHSAGVDSTGAPTVEQTQTSAQWRLNPHYQDGGFATAFSWGYRILEQLSYEDVLPNLRLTPQLSWSHDVGGISPIPTGEFVAGRKQAMVGLAAQYLNDFGAALRYNWYFGGGLANGLSDRDNLQLSFSYDF